MVGAEVVMVNKQASLQFPCPVIDAVGVLARPNKPLLHASVRLNRYLVRVVVVGDDDLMTPVGEGFLTYALW